MFYSLGKPGTKMSTGILAHFLLSQSIEKSHCGERLSLRMPSAASVQNGADWAEFIICINLAMTD